MKKTSSQSWLALCLSFLLMAGCTSLPERAAEPTTPPPDVSASNYHRIVDEMGQKHPGHSGFYALSEGIDALTARLLMIENAQVSLDVQYYIWHDDLVGKTLHHYLLVAADRGVKVRLLLDDLDTVGKDRLLSLIQYHPNIEIRLFNPFPNRNHRGWDFVSDAGRLDHRMHNKSITADRSVSIMGGRNIGSEYFNASEEVGFSDLDVIAMGPVARYVNNAFDLFWHSEWTFPLQQIVTDETISADDYQQFRRESDQFMARADQSDYAKALNRRWQEDLQKLTLDNLFWGRGMLWHDTPSVITAKNVDKDNFLAPHLWEALAKVEHNLVIVSPYFVPGPKFTEFLVDKVNAGVRVQILTNSLASNDVSLVYAGYRRYREQLLEGGVELYEFKPSAEETEDKNHKPWKGGSRASLHGKYIGLDNRFMFVGSFNLDPRSARLNTELGVLFESPPYASYLTEVFARDAMVKAYKVELDDKGDLLWKTLEGGKEVVFHKAPETSAWQRFTSGFMSWIVPESEL